MAQTLQDEIPRKATRPAGRIQLVIPPIFPYRPLSLSSDSVKSWKVQMWISSPPGAGVGEGGTALGVQLLRPLTIPPRTILPKDLPKIIMWALCLPIRKTTGRRLEFLYGGRPRGSLDLGIGPCQQVASEENHGNRDSDGRCGRI